MALSQRITCDAPRATAAAQVRSARPEILFVSRKWAPAVGGMETYSVKLSEELETFGNVTVQALRGKTNGSAPGLGAVLAFGLRVAAKILFMSRRFDVVHVGDMSSWPIAAIARLRYRNARIAISAHGTDVSFPDRSGVMPRLYGAYMRLGARLTGKNTVIANSHATASKAEALGFEATVVVPLATDMESALDERRPTSKGRTLLYAGRLTAPKGCRWFIENVLPELPEDVTLNVAGTIWDAEEERALSSPRVSYLGALPQDELRRAYAQADCVIVPNILTGGSGFEGFGLVAAEAAASGGLVLASAHTGLKDAVLDGETGLALPPGDAEAWRDALLKVLAWPEDERDRFVRNASCVARRRFAWSRVAESTLEAYGWAL